MNIIVGIMLMVSSARLYLTSDKLVRVRELCIDNSWQSNKDLRLVCKEVFR